MPAAALSSICEPTASVRPSPLSATANPNCAPARGFDALTYAVCFHADAALPFARGAAPPDDLAILRYVEHDDRMRVDQLQLDDRALHRRELVFVSSGVAVMGKDRRRRRYPCEGQRDGDDRGGNELAVHDGVLLV